MKMRIAVCDDNRLFLEELGRQLREIPMAGEPSLFASLEDFWESVDAGCRYDAVLMDIDWNDAGTGMDVAEELYRKSPGTKIIYVTGYNDRFSQHIFLHRANLSGYLTKPVDQELLAANLEKLKDSSSWEEPSMILKTHGQSVAVPFQDILYLESDRHNVQVFTAGEVITVSGKLSALMAGLPASFFQCHKSYIINMRQIRRIGPASVLLKNGGSVPVSRARYAGLKEAWFRFVDASFHEETDFAGEPASFEKESFHKEADE